MSKIIYHYVPYYAQYKVKEILKKEAIKINPEAETFRFSIERNSKPCTVTITIEFD